MERNVSYATMVSTGEQPDVTIHVTGFYEGVGAETFRKVFIDMIKGGDN